MRLNLDTSSGTISAEPNPTQHHTTSRQVHRRQLASPTTPASRIRDRFTSRCCARARQRYSSSSFRRTPKPASSPGSMVPSITSGSPSPRSSRGSCQRNLLPTTAPKARRLFYQLLRPAPYTFAEGRFTGNLNPDTDLPAILRIGVDGLGVAIRLVEPPVKALHRYRPAPAIRTRIEKHPSVFVSKMSLRSWNCTSYITES